MAVMLERNELHQRFYMVAHMHRADVVTAIVDSYLSPLQNLEHPKSCFSNNLFSMELKYPCDHRFAVFSRLLRDAVSSDAPVQPQRGPRRRKLRGISGFSIRWRGSVHGEISACL